MLNILVYAYQLSPYYGSECGLAWDYVVNMSKHNHLTVLYGSCEEYHQMGNTEKLEKYIKQHPIKNVTLVPVKPSFEFEEQDYSIMGISRFYKQYRRYQYDVYEVAKSLIDSNQYDLIHFLGPIGYREPGFLWKFKIPYMWGPVGGMVFTDLKLLKGAQDMKGGLQLFVKNIANRVQMKLNNRVRRAMGRVDLIIGCTSQTTKIIKTEYNLPDDHIDYLPQNCIKEVYPYNESKLKSDKIHIVWIGRIDFGKSLVTTIKALKGSFFRERFILHVVGDGHLMEKNKKLVNESGLKDNVIFHGKVDRDNVLRIIDKCHLHIITSLLDVNPTIFWETMSMCVPTLSPANNGLEDIINEDIGFLVPINSYEDMITQLSSKLDQVAQNPDCLHTLALNIENIREKYTWDYRVDVIQGYYEKAIENYYKNK